MSDVSRLPDWAKGYARGISCGHKFTVYADGDNFGVLKHHGHTAYTGGGYGSVWHPTHYVLIAKGARTGDGRTVHEGRVNRLERSRILAMLSAADVESIKAST